MSDVLFDPTQLSTRDLELAEAWREAGPALCIRVTAPFELEVGSVVFRYAALIPHFQTPAGLVLRAQLVVFDPASNGAIWREASKAGYFPVNMAHRLGWCDHCWFRRFLNMFAWCGPEGGRPEWHIGPWRGRGPIPDAIF